VANVCGDAEVSLERIHAFDFVTNEWAIALMQIYEQVYADECEAHGVFEDDGSPAL